MESLTTLKHFLELNNIEIESFNGWQLKTKSGDIWGMDLGIFYKNGQPVVEKILVEEYKPKKLKNK